VKVTRPHADLSRESLAHRVELLENRTPAAAAAPAVAAEAPAPSVSAPAPPPPVSVPAPSDAPAGPELKLEQVADAWQRSVVELVRDRQPPAASLLAGTKPTKLAGDTLTLEFPPGHDFHRTKLDEPKYKDLLREALYEVTGRRLAVVLEAGEADPNGEDTTDEPLSEDAWIALLEETFDAREVDDER
jgi:DNA polymerase III subunit gamma/tau